MGEEIETVSGSWDDWAKRMLLTGILMTCNCDFYLPVCGCHERKSLKEQTLGSLQGCGCTLPTFCFLQGSSWELGWGCCRDFTKFKGSK